MRAIIVAASLLVLVASASAEEAVRHIGPVTGIATNGNVIYSCSQAGVLKSDTDANKFTEIATPKFRIVDIATIGHQQLAICGGRPGESGTIGIVDLPSGKLKTNEFTRDMVYSVAVAPSHGSLAVACADGRVVLFRRPLDTAKAPIVIHKHTSAARAVAFSPDGKALISGGLDGVLLITPIADSGSRDGKTRALQEHTAGIECLTFSPDGEHFASGARDSRIRLHTIGGRLIRTYKGIGMEDEPATERVSARIWAVAWKNNQLVAGTSKGTLYRMSLEDDTWSRLKLTSESSIHSMAFAVNESLWIGNNSSLILFAR